MPRKISFDSNYRSYCCISKMVATYAMKVITSKHRLVDTQTIRSTNHVCNMLHVIFGQFVSFPYFVRNRFQFQCFKQPAHFTFPHGPSWSRQTHRRTAEYVCKHALERPVLLKCMHTAQLPQYVKRLKQWRSPKHNTHTHISSIADRTTLSAKCHRSSIQYTSYRPVNRLLIQTALIL